MKNDHSFLFSSRLISHAGQGQFISIIDDTARGLYRGAVKVKNVDERGILKKYLGRLSKR